MSTQTETEKLFAAMYVKAMKDDVRIKCPTTAVANNMRFQAYTFSRKMKKKLAESHELVLAINSVSLSVDGTDLLARGKLKYEGMQALIEALGGQEAIDNAQPKSQEEKDMEESQRRMTEKLAQPVERDTSRDTPYYKAGE